MATITSVGSGLWSAAGTWDSGVPVDNDVVVIAAGHTVEFDVDQSGFANGIDGLTITGTLSLTRTAGTYYLKIKAAKTITGAGTFDCGTSVSPIPFATKHTITGGTGWYVNGAGGLTMTVYAAEPTYKTIQLSALEAAGQTVLSVGTDVTGDIWAAGDEVLIADNYYGHRVDQRTIAVGGIAAGEITITSGLSGSRQSGSLVVLASRNVKFIGDSTSVQIVGGFTSGKLTIAGGYFYNPRMILSGGYATITDGVLVAATFGTSGVALLTLSGGVIYSANYNIYNSALRMSGGTLIGGATSCVSGANYGVRVTGGVIRNSIAGVGDAISNYLSNCTISYCTSAISSGTTKIESVVGVGNYYFVNFAEADLNNCQLTGTVSACMRLSRFKANNTLFDGTEVLSYTSLEKEFYSESIDHDQVAGAYMVWTAGGITTKQAVTVPTGYSGAMQTVLESATNQGWWQKEYAVGAGASINIEMQLRKDAAMTYLPRCIIFNKASTDPFAGGAGLHTFTMTNSIDTWEDDVYTYTNTGTEDVTLVIRCQGMNATGNMYSALEVEQINVDLTDAIALITAVKAKTDQLAFTIANQVDANALTGGGGATAEDVRIEMDANSTKLADILTDTGTTLDGIVDAIKAKTDNLPSDPADQSEIAALIAAIPAGLTVNDILTMVADGTLTFQDSIKLWNAALAGKLDGGGTGILKFRDPDDTVDRITAQVDLTNGDRDIITLDLT